MTSTSTMVPFYKLNQSSKKPRHSEQGNGNKSKDDSIITKLKQSNSKNCTEIKFTYYEDKESDQDFIELCNWLSHANTTTKYLILECDRYDLDVTSLQVFGRMLSHNTTLSKLYLKGSWTPATDALLQAIPSTNYLSYLHCQNCGFESANQISRILTSTTSTSSDNKMRSSCDVTIQTVILAFNNIGNGGIRSLAMSLNGNSLQYLDLAWNGIGDAGIQVLIRDGNLAMNRNLKTLILDGNDIGDVGMEILAKEYLGCTTSAHTTNTLERIDLSRNSYGHEGVQTLAKALSTNTTLKELILNNEEYVYSKDNVKTFFNSQFYRLSIKQTFADNHINQYCGHVKFDSWYSKRNVYYGWKALARCRNGDDFNRLPLHCAAKMRIRWLCGMQLILEAYPDAARFKDDEGRLPLHYALESGLNWNAGTKQLVEANYLALQDLDAVTGLYPFLLATTGPRGNLCSTYSLLRLHPAMIMYVGKS